MKIFLVFLCLGFFSQGLMAVDEDVEASEETLPITNPTKPTPTVPAAPSEPPKPVTSTTTEAEKRVWGVGLQAGYGETRISDSTFNSRNTITFGGVVDYSLSDQWSIQSELNLFKKGYKTPGGFLNDEVTLNYLEIPVFLKARTVWSYLAPQVFLGPSLAYLHSANKSTNGIDFDTTSASKRFELGFYVGLGLDVLLSQNFELSVSGRYGWGLTDIQDQSMGPGIYNRVFHLVGGFKVRL